jgi:uncharacterized protein DUF4255
LVGVDTASSEGNPRLIPKECVGSALRVSSSAEPIDFHKEKIGFLRTIMSSFTVLSAVSKALRKVLWEAFQEELSLRSLVSSDLNIVFLNPTDTAKEASNRLSLWLYQVTENEFLKNAPPVRMGNGHGQVQPPLAVNLHFLITPFGDTSEASLLLLGKVMEVLYDNAIIVIRDSNDSVFEELRINLSRLTLEELSRVWEALIEPYRLSVCYEVRVMHIDSRRTLEGARVVNVEYGFGEVRTEESF